MGYSFLHTLGIQVGIAESWEEYVYWAVKLGLDGDLRQQVRWDLARTQLPEQRSPLWNPTLFAQNLYAIFQRLGNF
jgi:protein O-GlcNAc transferase